MSGPPALVKPPGNPAVAGPRDPVESALLEYQSPAAALIARPVPPMSHYIIWTVAAMFTLAAAAAVLVPIETVVTAAGRVTATTGNLMVQPLEMSLVRLIKVKEGELVHAGDVLAELDPTFALANAAALDSQVDSLQAEVDRLTAETQNRPYLPDGSAASRLQAMMYAQRHAERSFKAENYAQKIKLVQVKIAQARADAASLVQRQTLANVLEDKRRQLERLKVGSQLNRLQATDTRVDIDSQLAAARSQVITAQRELDALQAERNDDAQHWMAETSQQLTNQGRLLADAREQLSKASLRRQLVQLRAERDAVVLRVAPVNVGTVMQAGQEFIELVPLDAPLQIEAVVEAKDIGFVRVGDPVSIKFETFPYSLYGMAMGTVRSVSPDSFQQPQQEPAKNETRAETAMGVLYFRARMSIDELQLHDLPEGGRIVPGMPVMADIRIGRRTVLRDLISRLIPAGSEAMREP